MRSLCFGIAALTSLISITARSDTIIVHNITVAANPIAAFSNTKVDSILSKINSILERSDYPWDTSCKGIRFRRNGDVIKSSGIPASGSDDQLFAARSTHAPSANIVLALDVTTCVGTSSVDGCGFVGSENFAIQPSIDDASVWLHERGHNMGLPHAEGETQSEFSVPQEWGKRVMFWQVGDRHFGLTANECARYKVKKFGSINEIAAIAAAGTDNGADAEPDLGMLTPKAREAVNPWTHSVDVQKIARDLSEADLASLRKMLESGKPNAAWGKALEILAVRGDVRDEPVIEKVLTMPSPVAAGAMTDEQQDQAVILRQLRLNSIRAAGIFCGKAKTIGCDTKLLPVLASSALIDTVEPELRDAVRLKVIESLTIAGTPAAKTRANELGSQIPAVDFNRVLGGAASIRQKYQIQ